MTHLVVSLGWDYERVAHGLDLPRVHALTKYWNDCPPMHVSVRNIAAALGALPKTSPTLEPAPAGELTQESVQSLVGAGFMSLAKPPPDPMLDLLFSELEKGQP